LNIEKEAAFRFFPLFERFPLGGAFARPGAVNNIALPCLETDWSVKGTQTIEQHSGQHSGSQQITSRNRAARKIQEGTNRLVVAGSVRAIAKVTTKAAPSTTTPGTNIFPSVLP
jgi:hypothetical protein